MVLWNPAGVPRTPEVNVVEISAEKLQEIAELLSSAAGDAEFHEAAERLARKAEQVADLVEQARKAEAEKAKERDFIAQAARRYATGAAERFRTQSEELAAKLVAGNGLDEFKTTAVMRAQFTFKLYYPLQDVEGTDELMARLQNQVREARSIVNGGRNSTDPLTRAFQEYERQAAVEFLVQWADAV